MTLFAKEENGHISLEDIFEPIIDSNIKMEGKKWLLNKWNIDFLKKIIGVKVMELDGFLGIK